MANRNRRYPHNPLPGATDLKPGSATRPFFGIKPIIVDADGNVLDGATTGNLCLAESWPGQMRTVYGDHDRFFQTYLLLSLAVTLLVTGVGGMKMVIIG